MDAIQTGNAFAKIGANEPGNVPWHRTGFAKHSGLIAVFWDRNKPCDHIPTAIAKDNDLIALRLFAHAEANVVTTFSRCCRRAFTVDNRDIKEVALMKF
jgi:hypothetical protein